MGDLKINGKRLWETIEEFSRFTDTPGKGVTRPALGEQDLRARRHLLNLMRQLNLEVFYDDFGNMRGRRAGTVAAAPPVLIGSHCDSVYYGGRFDGVLGVLAGLETIRALEEAATSTRHPIEVVNWTNEEGARFQPAMLGSGGATGRLDKQVLYAATDGDGVTFQQALLDSGFAGSEAHRPKEALAYLELHVEQGPFLDRAGIPVGVVEGIIGITWCEVTVHGDSDHAGPTPMAMRRDALMAAARVVLAVESIARDLGDPAVGTVGSLAVKPGGINIIPGQVTFSVDFRHPAAAKLDEAVARLEEYCGEVGRRTGTAIHLRRFWTSEPTAFAPDIIAELEASADALQIPCQRLWSAAGHDAKYAQDLYPSAMVFARSHQGISHNPDEYTAPEEVEAAASVLCRTAIRLAEPV